MSAAPAGMRPTYGDTSIRNCNGLLEILDEAGHVLCITKYAAVAQMLVEAFNNRGDELQLEDSP